MLDDQANHTPAGIGTDEYSTPSLKERVKQATRRMEAEIILQALDQHRWNRRRTARSLHISYRALLYKIKALGLNGGADG